MQLSSIKVKLVVCVLLLTSFAFYQQFWLQGVFTDNGVEQVITVSPLQDLQQATQPKLENSELFGIYQQETQPQETTLSQVFESAGREFIGELGNFQFVLYATAEFAGQLSAKLLVKNLESNEVSVETVIKGQQIKGAQVSQLALSNLALTSLNEQTKQTINLTLFSKIKATSPE